MDGGGLAVSWRLEEGTQGGHGYYTDLILTVRRVMDMRARLPISVSFHACRTRLQDSRMDTLDGEKGGKCRLHHACTIVSLRKTSHPT